MTIIRALLTFLAVLTMSSTDVYAALKPDISIRQIRDFSRVTFAWPEKVRFRVEPFNRGVTLSFNQPTDVNLSRLRAQLGDTLRNASQNASGTRVTLTFDQPYRVRHFISGKTNGIDILGARPSASTTKPEQAQAEPSPRVSTERLPAPQTKPKRDGADETTQPSDGAVADETESTLADPSVREPDVNAAEPVAPSPNETETQASQPATTEASDQQDNIIEAASSTEPDPFERFAQTQQRAPAVEPAETRVAKKPTPAPSRSPSATKDLPAAPAKASSANGTPMTAISPPNAPDAPPGPAEPEPAPASFSAAPSMEQAETGSTEEGPFLVTTYSLPTGTEIRFPWVKRVGAAVFMRDDVLWIIFNEARKVNMPMLQSILPGSILQVDQLPVPGHTVLRLQTDGTVYPKVTQPKNTAQWWVTLSIYRQMPASPIAIQPTVVGTTSPHLHVPTLQYGEPFTMTDPMIGDEMMIVPYFNVGEGVYPARSYPQVELLASAQGLAAVKKSDFAKIVQLRNGFRLSARDGLSLSEDLPELALAELESIGQSITWYPYESWRIESGQFFKVRRELEQQLLGASDVRANSLRLKLAQLHLGEGMANETLAWLQIIEQRDPFFFRDRQLEALRGAAHFINNDYRAAKQSFMDESLEGKEERKLWLEALSVFEQDRPRFDYMDYFPTYISKYPPLLREKLGIVAADNYINRKSFSRALKTLDTLSLTGIRDETSPYVYFLLGKVAAENDNMAGARELWEPLIEADANRFVRATTEFALTTMLFNRGEITREEAIDRLDRLRIVWRGDSLELTLLNYLGQLYADDGNYLEALRAWQDLVQQFPESDVAIEVARKMAETFNFLFTEGGADTLTPLQALATFYEFRQLTPIGEAGDEMILALADRLIDVDLLDRAAALLEHQIKFRQERLARSRLGAELALVYLLNQKPEQALEKLELTGFGQMPDDLSLRRKRLAAMAMADAGEPERGIEMLSYDASREADALRLRLFWKMRDWPNVIAMGERLFGARPDVTAPLDEMETEHLLQLAIAYMFERDRIQLEYLRNYFEPLMPDGPNKEIFMFVTDTGGPIDPQRFNKVSEQIARFEDFMSVYRTQVNEGGISSAIN